MPGGWEWLIILIVALLIFGKRLPGSNEVLRRGIVEFKKGVKGVEEEVEDSSSKTTQKKIETEKDVHKTGK